MSGLKPGRLIFKGGDAASLDKKKKKHKKKSKSKSTDPTTEEPVVDPSTEETDVPVGEEAYTIDAAKKMKYEELFPVETKKFGYDPKNASKNVKKSVEEALDDRVKKKADRYCK